MDLQSCLQIGFPNRMVWNVDPFLMGQRFRGNDNRLVVAARIVVDMRKATDFAVVDTIAIYKAEPAIHARSKQSLAIRDHHVEPKPFAGGGPFCKLGDLMCHDLQRADHVAVRVNRALLGSSEEKTKHMLAVCHSFDRVAMLRAQPRPQLLAHLRKTWHGAVVGKSPTLVDKGVGIVQICAAHGCPADMGKDERGIGTRRRPLKMLAVVGRPGLALNIPAITPEGGNPPSVRMAVTA